MRLARHPVTLLLLLVVVAALIWRFWPAGDAGQKGPQASPVKLATVAINPWEDMMEAVGTALANEQVDLTARITEKVTSVQFDEGQAVSAGDALVVLSTNEAAAELAAAQATLADASREYNRVKDISPAAIPKAQKDQRRARMEEARARADAARARLGDRVISAPFNGVIGLRNVSPGSLVTPGQVVATIADTSRIKVDASLPEENISKLIVGMKIQATTSAWPGKVFDGTLASIDNRVDSITRAITIRAIFENPEGYLKPGMLMALTLTSDARETIAIPEGAITAIGNQHFVYKLNADGKTVARVSVKVGTRRPGEVEITEGLEAGDTIVTEGGIRLKDGAAVAPVGESGGAAPTPPSGG